jgi:hypothetical protein
MKFLLFLCIALGSASTSTGARAEEDTNPPAKPSASLLGDLGKEFPPRLALPAGFSSTIDGVDAKCFAGPDYITVIRLAATYGKLYDWRLTALGTMNAFQLTLNSRDKTIMDQEGIIETYKDDREWFTLRLAQSQETIAGNMSGFLYEKYALWAVIIIETGYILVQGLRH